MGVCTITIRAEGSDSETTICVDMDGPTPRVIELVVRSGSGVLAPTLPSFDLNLLLQALVPSDVAPSGSVPPVSGDGASLLEPAEVIRSSVRGDEEKRPARASVVRGPGSSRRRSEAQVPKGRVYRRMPDDLVEIFNQAGTVTAVANHYGVPRHTAQGWIGRLRRRGGFSAAS